MSHFVAMLVFGLPLLFDSFTKGYAILPAFLSALVLASRKKARIKFALICAFLLATALYVSSNIEPVGLLAIVLLMFPATVLFTIVFAAAFRLICIGGNRYDRFLDGPTSA